MKPFSKMHFAIGLFLSLGQMAYAGSVYLGGAWNMSHCSQMAGAAGYPYYQYGGYVNGTYVVNACFGVYSNIPNPPPTSTCNQHDIEWKAWSLGMDAGHLQIRIRLSDKKNFYENCLDKIEPLQKIAWELEEMAEDKSSCRLLSTFFLDEVRPAFESLKSCILPAHYKALDPEVGEMWQVLEKNYRELRAAM